MGLTGNPARAVDVVTHTLAKAWSITDRFKPDSNLRGRLTAVMLSTNGSIYRKYRCTDSCHGDRPR